MAIMKSVQIMSESAKSFEDAIQVGVARMAKTVKGIKSCYINDQSCVVEGGNVTMFRVNMQVTFEVKD